MKPISIVPALVIIFVTSVVQMTVWLFVPFSKTTDAITLACMFSIAFGIGWIVCAAKLNAQRARNTPTTNKENALRTQP